MIKRNLRIRPIHHWTPRRRGRMWLAFTSLLCARHLGHRVRIRHGSMSTEAINHAQIRAESWVLQDPAAGKRLAAPMNHSRALRRIHSTVGAKPFTETVLLQPDSIASPHPPCHTREGSVVPL